VAAECFITKRVALCALAAGVFSTGAEAIRQREADRSPLGTEVISPLSYYYYIYPLYAGYLQFFIITDYYVRFIVRNGSGGLHLLIPVCGYLAFTTSFRFILVHGHTVIIIIVVVVVVVEVQGHSFALLGNTT
jgi:hypothetical protein